MPRDRPSVFTSAPMTAGQPLPPSRVPSPEHASAKPPPLSLGLGLPAPLSRRVGRRALRSRLFLPPARCAGALFAFARAARICTAGRRRAIGTITGGQVNVTDDSYVRIRRSGFHRLLLHRTQYLCRQYQQVLSIAMILFRLDIFRCRPRPDGRRRCRESPQLSNAPSRTTVYAGAESAGPRTTSGIMTRIPPSAGSCGQAHRVAADTYDQLRD